jgi:hypothetical protein
LLCYGWALGTWLVFALLSNNFSGWCLSVRWFVPLLAGGYFLLALLLRERPDLRLDFLLLTGWGLVLAPQMWVAGTWHGFVPYFWPTLAGALATWLAAGRVFPPFVDRLSRYLGPLLGLALAATALAVLVAGQPSFERFDSGRPEWAEAQRAIAWMVLGLAGGAWARAQRRPWLVLGLTLPVGAAFVGAWPFPDERHLAWLVLGLAALAVSARLFIPVGSTGATNAARSR